MRLKIGHKIFLAIIATAIFSLLTLQFVQQGNFEKGLRRYADTNLLGRLTPISSALTTHYAEQGNWDFIRGKDNPSLGGFLRVELAGNDLTDIDGVVITRPILSTLIILDKDSNWVAGASPSQQSAARAITLEGEIIGYLALAPLDQFVSQIDQRFADQQNNNRIWTSLAILLGALFSAFLVSRNLGRPIKNLNKHVQSLSDGKYNIELPTYRSDELGSLAKNFNNLADTLRSNRDQRRQWISDISHELRTPVSILSAEIVCIEEGLQSLDLDTIASFKSEVERIKLLINDLHQLSQADSGTLNIDYFETDISKEITNSLRNHKDQFEQKQITVDTDLTKLPLIWCDPNRIGQVIDNLLQNTLRYTDTPGKLHISGYKSNDTIVISFKDSAPSVPDESIDYLFDRLYRVDPSRNRKTGATGLGLSICAAIIKAHHGNISASSSALGGLAVQFDLPIKPTD